MKKTIFNIIVATLIVALMFMISMTAISLGYTPEVYSSTPETTTSSDYLSVWKQSVTAEYTKHNIIYKGGDTQ